MSEPNTLVDLPWDSQHFGLAIGRIKARDLNSRSLADLLDRASSRSLDLVEAFCSVDDEPSIVALEESGFRYAGIKTSLRLDLTIPRCEIGPPEGMVLDEARPEDAAPLAALFGGRYSHSRYYHTEGVSPDRIRAMFEVWITKAVSHTFDDVCLVLRQGDQLAGFCSLRLIDERVGRYGLMGVRVEHQGKGMGAFFIHASAHWLRNHSRVIMETITQGRNRPALRLFERAGFLTHYTELCMYRKLP